MKILDVKDNVVVEFTHEEFKLVKSLIDHEARIEDHLAMLKRIVNEMKQRGGYP